MPPKRGDGFVTQKIKGVPDPQENAQAGPSTAPPQPRFYRPRFAEPLVAAAPGASLTPSETPVLPAFNPTDEPYASVPPEMPAMAMDQEPVASKPSPPPAARTPPITPVQVPLKDTRILAALKNLRMSDRIGPFGIVDRILSDETCIYEDYRTRFFQESNDSLTKILDLVAQNVHGSRKLRAWLQSELGSSLVADIVSDEMDAVTASECIQGLADITPDDISSCELTDHITRAPFLTNILVAAAQTERAKVAEYHSEYRIRT
ncbi:hypothetical protein BKA70DRAFT_1507774 [Coprinopsis sp. MPI-PUGE-AT-0042]|nr:hypothetical protein BKA70DRAFT_1507774 [Coprinopsis sp. MPI-PUGE-AT-0042]